MQKQQNNDKTLGPHVDVSCGVLMDLCHVGFSLMSYVGSASPSRHTRCPGLKLVWCTMHHPAEPGQHS